MKLGRLQRPTRGRAPGSTPMQFSKYVVAFGLCALSAVAWACSPGQGTGHAGDAESGGSGGRGRGGASGAAGTGGTGAVITQGGSSGSDGTGGGSGECVTCTPDGGTYCGQIGDNC